MVLTYLPVTLASVVVSIATIVVIVYTVVICVCQKRGAKDEPKLTDVKIQRNSGVLSPVGPGPRGSTDQNDIGDPGAVHLETDTAITPLEQGPKQNGTLHSRGNSADLNKPDRHSGTSSGSSPRQATLSRVLPDIPVQSKGNHSHLPDVPTRQSNYKSESAARGHSHSQLPDIPKSHTTTAESNLRGGLASQNKSPTIPRSDIESKPVVRLSMEVPAPTIVPVSNKKADEDLDDYDHINESNRKLSRPRSDYDHVLIEGDHKRLIPAKQIEDPDYAEVRNDNIYEGVTDDVTVVKIKPTSNVTQTKTKTSIQVGKAPVKESCVDDPDPPYNRIKDDTASINSSIKGRRDPPYNKIKDDLPYSGIKDITDPYNTVKEDDPYNKVKGDGDSLLDDADPYNTVVDTDSEKPRRKFPPVKAKFDGPNYDPYALLDDDRNVSNQSGSTDPYSRVCDTEIDDPYNRVNDDDDNSGAKPVTRQESDVQDADQGYSTVKKVGRVEYATVNKVSIRRKTEEAGNVRQQRSSREHAPDEYSTVMKVRQEKTGNDNTDTAVPGTSQMERVTVVGPRRSQPPEEPPRDYDDNDNYDNNIDADHYNTVLQVSGDRGSPVVTTAISSAAVVTTVTTTNTITTTIAVGASGAHGTNTEPGVRKKEPPYTKLSARESLASMNARMASNTYETVSEVDNLYATVEGGSGDGVVGQENKRQSAPGRSSVSELYAEIPENVSTPAPAPPSLDSLHETAKQQSNQRTSGQGHCRTPSGQGHVRTSSDQGHFRTPSGDMNSSSVEGRVTLATEEVVDLDPASFKAGANAPDDLEYDPNYETVEEAKSRVKYEEINGSSKTEKKIRAHVYEEVTVTNEARRTRQRVLNQHMYEDITEVKDSADNTNAGKANGDVEIKKSVDGKMATESGAAGIESKVESKSKKSKSDNEKTKDKVKDRKKSESKDKSEKSGKTSKK